MEQNNFGASLSLTNKKLSGIHLDEVQKVPLRNACDYRNVNINGNGDICAPSLYSRGTAIFTLTCVFFFFITLLLPPTIIYLVSKNYSWFCFLFLYSSLNLTFLLGEVRGYKNITSSFNTLSKLKVSWRACIIGCMHIRLAFLRTDGCAYLYNNF